MAPRVVIGRAPLPVFIMLPPPVFGLATGNPITSATAAIETLPLIAKQGDRRWSRPAGLDTGRCMI